MTLSDLKKLFRKYIKVLPGGPATDDITRGVGVLAVLDTLAEELKASPAGTPLPIATTLAAVQQDLSDGLDLTAGARYDITGNWNAAGAPATVFVQALRVDAFSPSGILLTGGVYSRVKVNVPAGTAVADAGAAVVLYDATGPHTDGPMTQKATTDALAGKGSLVVQQQHSEQLAKVAVRDSQVYGYLEAGGAPVGYGSFDASTADTRQKVFQTFNVAQLTLTTSNPASGTGWAYSTNAQGTTLQLNADVVLSLPGSNSGTLTFTDFYVQGNRGSKLRLLTTAPASTAPALLPFLRGYCATPLELASGGAVLLSGYYVSLTGTGTVYALEPFKADSVAAGVTVVKIGGGGAGTVKSVNGTGPDAAGNVVIATGGGSDAYAQLAFQPTPTLDLSLAAAQLLTLTNNVSFAGTSNRAQGRQVRVFLFNNTAAAVTLTFPSAWAFLGVKPTTLAAGKKGVLTLECVYGSAEGDIVAGYVDQN